MFGRFRRKPSTIQVEEAYLPDDLPEYFVSLQTLHKLSKHKQLIETPGDFHLITKKEIFTFVKPNGTPRILKINSLTMHPDSAGIMIHLDRESLFKMANLRRVTVLETPGEYVISTRSMTLIASKEGEK